MGQEDTLEEADLMQADEPDAGRVQPPSPGNSNERGGEY